MEIQMPDDVKSVGYRQTRPFCWEQVFHSDKHNFEGTELDFVGAGYAYKYIELERDHIRIVI